MNNANRPTREHAEEAWRILPVYVQRELHAITVNFDDVMRQLSRDPAFAFFEMATEFNTDYGSAFLKHIQRAFEFVRRKHNITVVNDEARVALENALFDKKLSELGQRISTSRMFMRDLITDVTENWPSALGWFDARCVNVSHLDKDDRLVLERRLSETSMRVRIVEGADKACFLMVSKPLSAPHKVVTEDDVETADMPIGESEDETCSG